MANSLGNEEWSRWLRRRHFAAYFVAHGSLYSTGYDNEEADLIREELVELGIQPGGRRVRKLPRQLDEHELVFSDSEPEPPMYGPDEQAMTLWADRDGKRSWVPTSTLRCYQTKG